LARISIGIDIGGTNIRFGIVDEAGNITVRKKAKTEAGEGFGRVLGRLQKGISALTEKVSADGHTLKGIGIGVPGIISPEEGIVRFSPNLPGWLDVPLRDSVASLTSVPVLVENDANAYALGEATYGAGRGVNSLLCITLGTGVGGGIILDNGIWRGADGMAGEVGHMTVDPRGPLCQCSAPAVWRGTPRRPR
jgi:glucokinase